MRVRYDNGIIVGMKKIFSIKSLNIGIIIDNYFKIQFNYENCMILIEKYEVSFLKLDIFWIFNVKKKILIFDYLPTY